jgi:hypothetical protein
VKPKTLEAREFARPAVRRFAEEVVRSLEEAKVLGSSPLSEPP